MQAGSIPVRGAKQSRFSIMDNTLGYEPGNRSSILLGEAKVYVRVTRKARERIANPFYAGSTPVMHSTLLGVS